MMAFDTSIPDWLGKYRYRGSAMTVKPVFAENVASVALTPAKPVRRVVTFPEVSMLATKEFVTLQVAEVETSVVEPSENARIADNFVGAVAPINTLSFAGAIFRAIGMGGPTFNGAVLEMDAEAAVMLTMPCLRVVTRPEESTVARVGSETDQVTALTVLDVLSEKVPVAVNCCVNPAATVAF